MKKLGYGNTLSACFIGYITQAIINNFAPLLFLTFQSEFGIGLDKITLLVTINFFTQLFVDMIAAKAVDRIGYKPCVIAAHVFSAAGLIGLATFPSVGDPYAGLITAVVLYAIGGGLIEVLISPIAEACPTRDKTGAMSLLHSFYCWGSAGVILISTVILGAVGAGNWRWLAAAWAIVPIFNAIYFGFVPVNMLGGEEGGTKIRKLLSSKTFWLFAVMMLCAGAAELSMSQWASAFAESGLGVSKTQGDLFGPCLFAILMGAARVLYAKFGAKLNAPATIFGCCILCLGSYLLAALSPDPVLGLIGCALCGFSVGIFWPATFSLAIGRMPKGGTALFALLSLSGDMGCTGGPTLVGFVSDAADGSLATGLLFSSVFPVILAVCSAALFFGSRRRSGGKKDFAEEPSVSPTSESERDA